ncbi:hypothetical protein H9P43_003396 [Blastocladiella emersonii ATCC 22665]|nr:hypothetical protein H9P43_003396 [Blastocladiella emersonii ATCC 22665]
MAGTSSGAAPPPAPPATTIAVAASNDNLAPAHSDYTPRVPERSTLPVWLNQFIVMMKRNLRLTLRYKKSTLAQTVAAPVIFTLLLLLLQSLYTARQKRETLNPKAYPLSGVVRCQGATPAGPCITVMYTPDNDATRLVMRTMAAKNAARTGLAPLELAAQPLSSLAPPSSQVGIVAVPSADFIYDYVLQNPNSTQFGVHFQATLPAAKYQLWYNTTQALNGSDIYDGQVLAMQRALDEAIIAVAATPNATADPASFPGIAGPANANFIDIDVKDWPTVAPDYVPDTLVSNLGPMFFFCSVMVIFISVLQTVVNEKETLLRHAMATMGLKASVFWVSTFVTQALLVAVAAIVTPVMGLICGFTAFSGTAFGVMFLLFFLFGLSMVAFAFFITTFCRRARVAVLIGIFVFIIGLLFESFAFSSGYIGYIWYDSGTSPGFYYVLMHLPFFNFGRLYLDISIMTTGKFDVLTNTNTPGPGFPFSALYDKIPQASLPVYGSDARVPDVPVPATSLYLMLMNIAIYGVLAWYLDKVIPDEYGRAYSPVFFLQPSYWGVRKASDKVLQDFIDRNQPLGDKPEFKCDREDDDVAAERKVAFDKNISPALRIGNLRKIYRNNLFGASKLDKVAVKSLCLTLEEGTLFALLGRNGAGKSTTTSILAGLTPPTAGDATIFGCSVTDDMDQIREMMGICPQHDILFDELTPIEHIELYGGLKHLSQREIELICRERLEAVRLWKVKDQPSGTFSGGMKRRLSVVIATIGDPRILLLDEPTTGMDSRNRRHVLSDRVGIMVNGRMFALGSSTRLKSKFGIGYRIALTTHKQHLETVKNLVKQQVPEAELEDDSGGALIYRVPQSFTPRVPAFVTVLESEQVKPMIESWGLSQTSLEEVFLRVLREALREEEEEKAKKAK